MGRPKKTKPSIKLSGRIGPDQTYPEEDRDFVAAKLEQGWSQGEIIRQAVDIWRRYETGVLFKELILDLAKDNLKFGLPAPSGGIVPEQSTETVEEFDEAEMTAILDRVNGDYF